MRFRLQLAAPSPSLALNLTLFNPPAGAGALGRHVATSGPYSDAIAGVINFQLRSAKTGGKATATYGKYYTDVQGVEPYTGVQTNADGSPGLTPDGVLTLNYTGDDRRRRDGRTVTLAGVVAVPTQPFHDTHAGDQLVRWAFCKETPVIEEALRRLGSGDLSA